MLACLGLAGIVLLLMMLLRLTRRLAAVQWIDVQANTFYVIMTMHGARWELPA